MKVYLDDERTAPEGWTHVRWPDEAIKLLQTGQVTHLSLDHDLGDDLRGTGYDVLLWIEQEAALRGFIPPAMMQVHSANPGGRIRMLAAIEAIQNRQPRRSRQPSGVTEQEWSQRMLANMDRMAVDEEYRKSVAKKVCPNGNFD